MSSMPVTTIVPQKTTKSKRPSNHETLLMSLAMLDMIPKVGKISAVEIHLRLNGMGYERDLRSIQRQLEALSAQFPIERDDSSKPYGYKWSQEAKGIAIPALTLQESLLLNLAEKYLRNLLPASLKLAMDGFFRQARFSLQGIGGQLSERRWLDKVHVVNPSVSLLPPDINCHVLDAISHALFHETWLNLEYTNQASERRERRVMPLGLVQQGARLVLVVRFEGHDDVRSLAVSRIGKAQDTGLPFVPVTDFDLAAYEEHGGFGYSHGKVIKLQFRIDKKLGMFLTESRLSKDQTVVELDTQLEITATVAQSEHLVWWLRGFGRHVNVIFPTELAQQIAT